MGDPGRVGGGTGGFDRRATLLFRLLRASRYAYAAAFRGGSRGPYDSPGRLLRSASALAAVAANFGDRSALGRCRTHRVGGICRLGGVSAVARRHEPAHRANGFSFGLLREALGRRRNLRRACLGNEAGVALATSDCFGRVDSGPLRRSLSGAYGDDGNRGSCGGG